MKDFSKDTIIPAEELVTDGVYFSQKGDLIQIKQIDNEKKELHLFNVSEQTNYFKVRFNRHILVKKVR